MPTTTTTTPAPLAPPGPAAAPLPAGAPCRAGIHLGDAPAVWLVHEVAPCCGRARRGPVCDGCWQAYLTGPPAECRCGHLSPPEAYIARVDRIAPGQVTR